MRNPIYANDGYFYEEEMLMAHLRQWEETYSRDFAQMSPARQREVLQLRSPMQAGDIDLDRIQRIDDHYNQIFEVLKENYNQRNRDSSAKKIILI